MIEQRTITTGPGLTFDALTAGPPNGRLVLFLHGFAESFHTWRSQVRALAAAGYRAVAPHQRGYSPGARPDTGVRDLRCGQRRAVSFVFVDDHVVVAVVAVFARH